MDSELLIARVCDAIDYCEKNNKPKFLGFLSVEEAVLVENFIKNRTNNYCFYGGYENAQRVYLCCYPEWMESPSFPIKPVTFTFRDIDELKHRDFLGSLMALGITRETVGDILVEKGRAVVFVSADILDFVIENITKIGRVGVNLKQGFEEPLPIGDTKTKKTITVASCRLDCIVSAVANLSRNSACDFIESGFVSVNSVETLKPTKIIVDGDVLSIRRKGKFHIISTQNHTKKDRILLEYYCF